MMQQLNVKIKVESAAGTATAADQRDIYNYTNTIKRHITIVGNVQQMCETQLKCNARASKRDDTSCTCGATTERILRMLCACVFVCVRGETLIRGSLRLHAHTHTGKHTLREFD